MVAQGADKGFALGVDFGEVIVFALDLQRRAQGGGAVAPNESAPVAQRHAALVPGAVDAGQQLHGHGIEHLVAQHHAVHGGGQMVGPLHHIAKRGQPRLLALAQAARDIDDGVALQRHALRLQGGEHLLGQCPAARAKFPHFMGGGVLQCFDHLGGQRLPVQRRQLRRRHKVAAIGGHSS